MSGISNQVTVENDNNAISESGMRISYKICHEIAKELKTFNEAYLWTIKGFCNNDYVEDDDVDMVMVMMMIMMMMMMMMMMKLKFLSTESVDVRMDVMATALQEVRPVTARPR
ncbi:hypothetical protein ANN_14103 [Periplaneta americana]|uniref:Uncharacterized protein n=1 Tax=Periplaneta americana TaxID=6978 RepID=A0ABQ8SVD2_PERAM|nr:hypothetical protein ANN_14103 [Periplaneta americana]